MRNSIKYRWKRTIDRIEDWQRYLTHPSTFLHKISAASTCDRLMETTEIKTAMIVAEEQIKRQNNDMCHSNKYVNISRYIPLNLRRVYALGLHKREPLSILDMGAGAGFFLYCCTVYGHDAMGFDADSDEFFEKMHKALGVTCLQYTILPQIPLPDFGRRFDLITAFAVCFHGGVERWDSGDWRFFLEDLLRNHCTNTGIIHLHLHDSPPGNRNDVRQKIISVFPMASCGYHTVTLSRQNFDSTYRP
jgi:hypothetical protein